MVSFSSSRSAFATYGVLLVLLLVAITFFHVVEHDFAAAMLHEGGVVEVFSAIGYGLCVLVMVLFGGGSYLRQHYPLTVLTAMAGLRELDFDKRFTETGLLQSRMFTSGDVALGERLAGLLVMASLIVLGVLIIRRYLMPFLRQLIRFDPVALGVALAFGFAAVSKTIDGLGRKLEPVGIMVSEQINFSAAVVEEVLELGMPVALITATLVFLCRQPQLAYQPVRSYR